MKRTIKIEQEYAYPQQMIWDSLTNREYLAEWLMENDFKPIVGHAFQFRTKPQPGFNGIIDSKVLKVQPISKLSFTWRTGNIDTVVSFRLEASAKGTRLHLEHAGFEGIGPVITSFILGAGWKGNLLGKRLKRFLESMSH